MYLHVCVHGDSAGCVDAQSAPSGSHALIRGPTTSCPISVGSSLQSYASRSTPAAKKYSRRLLIEYCWYAINVLVAKSAFFASLRCWRARISRRCSRRPLQVDNHTVLYLQLAHCVPMPMFLNHQFLDTPLCYEETCRMRDDL